MKNIRYINETLSYLGLSRNQTELYLGLLRSGPATVTETARNLNTSRQALYLLLPDLLDRGLIKEVSQGKRPYYQALPPSQLLTLVEDLKDRIENIVPSLTNIQAIPAEVPLVTVYDTPLSMREWYRHFMDTAQTDDDFFLYSSGNLENWYKLDEKFYHEYLESQVNIGVKVRCLLPEGLRTQKHNEEVGWSVTEFHYTPEPLTTNVHQWVWRDQVCYQTIQAGSSNMIVLQSAQLANFTRKQFLRIWEGCK